LYARVLLADLDGDRLAAVIHRGRDHGLPTYVDVRTKCGLAPVSTFAELNNTVEPGVIAAIERVYEVRNRHFAEKSVSRSCWSNFKHVDDIDLLVGGLAERPLSGAVVGPTFGCLLGHQFHILKKGDRFWYENNIPPSALTKGETRDAVVDELPRLPLRHLS